MTSSATQTVRDYLDAMESRDLEGAKGYLAEGFTMTFPGDAVFSTLDELIAWAKPRYRSIAKKYERFDQTGSDGDDAVYCFGTLYGEWPDGTPFEGIRFIDRFTVKGDKLVDQRVWNDLAEVRQ